MNIIMANEIEQPSTGIVEDGERILVKPSCTEIGEIKSKVWSVIKNLGDEINMLNQFFHHIDTKGQVTAKEPSSALQNDTPLFRLSDEASDTSSPISKKKNQRDVNTKPKDKDDRTLSEDKVAESRARAERAARNDAEDAGEMFSIIKEAMDTDHLRTLNVSLKTPS